MTTQRIGACLVLVLSINLAGNAQEVIGVSGLSAHSLTKLKDFQQYYVNDAIVTLKSTQAFPPYLQYGGIVRFPVGRLWKVGAYVYGTSTAARSPYEDYSGMITVDQSLRCIGLGLYGSFDLSQVENGTISVYCVPGINLSTMTASVDIRVGDDHESSTEDYAAMSPVAEVGLEYSHGLGTSHFTYRVSGGFLFSRESMLTNEKSESEWEYVNWTGGKLMLGIGYNFANN
jgi:hypothetical protein